VPALRETTDAFLVAGVGLALLAFGLVLIPMFLRWFLGLRPLPAGPLRDRLSRTAARLRFRVNDILVWDTQHSVANALVTGVVPWLRYVVITDRLLEQLNDEEIEAVFGHEVGHLKHHHMLFYMIFIVMSLLLLSALWNAAGQWFQGVVRPEWLPVPLSGALGSAIGVWFIVGVVALYVVVVFGWLSRRCERQADLFGCKTASADALVSALEKVADLNGMSRDRPGFLAWWQHSTIAERVRFIRQLAKEPELERRFHRRLGWIKWGLTLGMIALVVWVGSTWGWHFAWALW
ncbi:MAG: M48 family metallopeptidase, partial [Gemmataceae bacterium]|nr:M48 family metallopeptidase [Gemmataceae bacterium]